MTQRIELADPAAYRAQLAHNLAGREPLDVMAETPGRFGVLLGRYDVDVLRRRPFAGKWTPLEVLGHVLDTEWTFGYRLRTILCDDRPSIIGMDQEKWAAVQKHNHAEPADLLEPFRLLRGFNLALWRRIEPGQLERVGVHSERGEESLETMRLMIAGHDLSHLDQFERFAQAARQMGA